MTESIHGMRAPATREPTDLEQLTQILAKANSEGTGVCIAGGATKLDWGNRPDRFDLLLSTQALRSRCDVDVDDLIVTISAGYTVAETRARAREMGRVLPLDPGQPHKATVGGVAATGDQGARGTGYGRVRDLVLGLRATLADGTQVQFGGRTMKNVAGYAMSKLFIGSFGVLGVITEVTFRLLPRPEAQGMLAISLPSLNEAGDLVSRILDSGLEPLVLQVVPSSLLVRLGNHALLGLVEDGGGPVLLAGFAGHPAVLARSMADVSAWSAGRQTIHLANEDTESVMEGLAGSGAAMAGGEPSDEAAHVNVRATVPISDTCRLAEAAVSIAHAHGLSLGYQVNAGCGLVDMWMRGEADPEERARTLTAWVTEAREAATAHGGSLAVTAGLTLLEQGFDAWGEIDASLSVMRAVKQRFDPRRTLNPGRFVGGI